jgi:tetratricopeptide (TPR) repeat protein
LRVKGLSILLIAVCGFAAWRSIRIAIADWVASAGTPDGLEHAIRLAPDRGELLAREAMYKNDNGDQSSAVDEELQRAARLNPLDSSVLMTLGMREEFRGNSAAAEGYLVHAAEIDHQFKPAWTLANYYYRTDQPGKGWPMIERILSLEPLGFNPIPVFDLCWKQAGDNEYAARKILSLIPKAGQRPGQYLQFLIGTHRADAALDAWPTALAAADPASPSNVGVLTGFVDFLAGADRVREAVTVWNQLVDRGIIHCGRLDPAKGVSIADPDFRFPASFNLPNMPNTFGWHVAEIPGVFASGFAGSLRLEINGDEPQSFQVLSTHAPVVSGAQYHLHWKSDGSALNSPQDPGFSFQIVKHEIVQGQVSQTSEAVTQCPPLLSVENPVCDFVAPADAGLGLGKVRIDLRYTRAQGTTRVSGVLQVFSVRLERGQ